MKLLDVKVMGSLLSSLKEQGIELEDVNRNETLVFKDVNDSTREYRVYESGYVRGIKDGFNYRLNKRIKRPYQINKTRRTQHGNVERLLCTTVEEALVRLLAHVSNRRSVKNNDVIYGTL